MESSNDINLINENGILDNNITIQNNHNNI